jgi:hypothetical protein
MRRRSSATCNSRRTVVAMLAKTVTQGGEIAIFVLPNEREDGKHMRVFPTDVPRRS